MKTIPIPISRDLPDAVLYVEDIDAIVKVLETTCTDVEIEVPGYIFDSVDELVANSADSIDHLTIAAREPYVKIEFSTRGNSVYTTDSGPIHVGLAETVDQIVRRRRRVFQGWYAVLAFTCVDLLALFLIVLLPAWFSGRSPAIASVAVFVAFSFLLTAWIVYRGRTPAAVIYFCRRAERPSFLVRKKDDVILAVISAVIGALLGVGGTVVAQKLGVASDQPTPGTEVEARQGAP